jgi:spore maturation protein CgeB
VGPGLFRHLQRRPAAAAATPDAGCRIEIVTPEICSSRAAISITSFWPPNVERIEHLPPAAHRTFYNSQRFTMNITRADMIKAGYSPSVRLFEAAACGTPIISDYWEGIDSFFEIGSEILIATSPADTIRYLKGISEEERKSIGENAQKKVLTRHTAAHRASELIAHYDEMKKKQTMRQHAGTDCS